MVVITLAGGKAAEFLLAMKGSFKGVSDFGETEFPAEGLRKIVLK